jgi:hypothetical protein
VVQSTPFPPILYSSVSPPETETRDTHALRLSMTSKTHLGCQSQAQVRRKRLQLHASPGNLTLSAAVMVAEVPSTLRILGWIVTLICALRFCVILFFSRVFCLALTVVLIGALSGAFSLVVALLSVNEAL